MNMSRARGPRYSLEYLTFMATKKKRRQVDVEKRGEGEEEEEEEGRDEREEGSASTKRPRVGFPPTVTETMRELWKEMRADGYILEK